MSAPQSYLSNNNITQSDITASIDYNDANAADPDPGTVFLGQADVDRFLYENGATNFKHLMAFWDALPKSIAHVITLNLAEGDHYPRSSDTTRAWNLEGKIFVGGSIVLNGGLPSTYVSRDGYLEDLVPASTQTGSYDPYMTFSGTPFSTFDLHGWFAVFDTGQVTIIHDHDDSTLYFIDELSPTPTSVTVARPSTRLLNDDGYGARQANVSFSAGESPKQRLTQLEVTDLVIAPYGGTAVTIFEGDFRLTHVVLDNTVGPSEAGVGFSIAGYNNVVRLACCSRLTTLGSTSSSYPFYLREGANVFIVSNYIRGGKEGAFCGYHRDIMFSAIGLVMDNVGDPSTLSYTRASLVLAGTRLRLNASGNGKQNEFRNGTVPGLLLIDGGYIRGQSFKQASFTGMTAPCVILKGTAIMDLTIFGTEKLLDGGGNTDVGIQVDGPSAEVRLTTDTDVSGSVGDVRMADGTILSYSYIDSEGPVIDFFHNVIEII